MLISSNLVQRKYIENYITIATSNIDILSRPKQLHILKRYKLLAAMQNIKFLSQKQVECLANNLKKSLPFKVRLLEKGEAIKGFVICNG